MCLLCEIVLPPEGTKFGDCFLFVNKGEKCSSDVKAIWGFPRDSQKALEQIEYRYTLRCVHVPEHMLHFNKKSTL